MTTLASAISVFGDRDRCRRGPDLFHLPNSVFFHVGGQGGGILWAPPGHRPQVHRRAVIPICTDDDVIAVISLQALLDESAARDNVAVVASFACLDAVAVSQHRSPRTTLISTSIGLALLLVGVWFASDYYYWFFAGPDKFDDAELAEMLREPSGGILRAYVELENRELIDTGWTEESTNNGRVYSTAKFVLTPLGDDYLLVLAEPAATGERLVGQIGNLRQLDRDVIAAVENEDPQFRGRILPVKMAANAAFTVFGYIGLVVGVPLLCWLVWRFAWSLAALLRPETSVA
jgi:hypothetical protein